MAKALAEKAGEGADSNEAQAKRLIKLALGRQAEAAEVAEISRLISGPGLEDAAGVLLNTNEFVYIP